MRQSLQVYLGGARRVSGGICTRSWFGDIKERLKTRSPEIRILCLKFGEKNDHKHIHFVASFRIDASGDPPGKVHLKEITKELKQLLNVAGGHKFSLVKVNNGQGVDKVKRYCCKDYGYGATEQWSTELSAAEMGQLRVQYSEANGGEWSRDGSAVPRLHINYCLGR
jgi:hypothetical protein